MTSSWIEDNKRRILSEIDFNAYYSEHVQGLHKVAAGQVLGTCPFHDDRKGSLSINTETGLWNCKGCNEAGDVFTFHGRTIKASGGFVEIMKNLASKIGISLSGGGPEWESNKKGRGGGGKPAEKKSPDDSQQSDRETKPKKPLPTAEQLEAFHQRLLNDERAMGQLLAARGLTEETVKSFMLGLADKKEKSADDQWITLTRVTIPIWQPMTPGSLSNYLVNVRMYSTKGRFKMVSWAQGYGGKALYGADQLPSYPPGEPVLVCEGEFDRMLLCQSGFNAVTSTNGAKSFDPSWGPLFQDRDVILVYDADDGGREGASKTTQCLAPCVKSLKIIDLEAIGLVDGTPESNDITDAWRADARNWAVRLREAINHTVALDLQEVAAEADSGDSGAGFVRIFEQGGAYWRPGKEDALEISNFQIRPRRLVRVNNQDVLEGRIHVSGNGATGSDIVLTPSDWATRGAFRKKLGELGAGWTGSENELQELRVLLSRKSFQVVRGEAKLGFHRDESGRWIFIASDKTITATDEIADLVHWKEYENSISYPIASIRPATTEETTPVLNALQTFNTPDVVAPILAWMFSLPFRARLRYAVPQLQGQFPVLMLWGQQGSGKTKTIETAVLPFYAQSQPRKIDAVTTWTLLVNSHATNFIPLAFDEYKPWRLSPQQNNEISTFLRSVYNGATGERGFSNQAGRGVNEFTYTAPIILMGETGLQEEALRERIIEVTLDRDKRQGYSINQFLGLNMAGVGLNYIRWSLGISDRDVSDVWLREAGSVDESLVDDRVRQNVATMQAGLVMMGWFFKSLGLSADVDGLIAALNESQCTNLLDGGTRAKTAVDRILEGFSAMAALDLLREGKDYKVKHEIGRLCLRLHTIYPVFKEWAGKTKFDGDMMDAKAFGRALKSAEYYVGLGPERFGGYTLPVVKVWQLDIEKMAAMGLDLTGFQIDASEHENSDEIPF